MPEEKSSHTNIMERTEYKDMLNFTSTNELPYPHNKVLDLTVEEEHARREKDESRISP